MTPHKILIACIGNIFLGDDAFGVEVFQRLACRPMLEGVRVTDFGIRGLDLTYALLEEWDIVILVDAAPRGHEPGTLYVIEPTPGAEADSPADDVLPGSPLIDAHGMDPVKVLRAVRMMGGGLKRLLVVGCEPAPFNADEEMQMALSPQVEAALPGAVELIESLIAKEIGGECAPQLSSRNQKTFTKGDVTHGVPQRTP
ncbi:MAG TPA: hydrogenase maturation protease [Tepidisphaeraceae bacterium]|jgi:hydrogenase maturation protease